MTIGERIQQYRKAQKLSQEELANQLFVSRQTVSLWEKDQTLPTIDNLIRLKEIFNVSIDELLTGTPEAAEPTDPTAPSEPTEPAASADTPRADERPKTPAITGVPTVAERAKSIDASRPSGGESSASEDYTFRYTASELKDFYKTTNRRFYRGKVIVFAVLFLLFFYFVHLEFTDTLLGIYVGIVGILAVLNLVAYFRGRKAQKKSLALVTEKDYRFEVQADRLAITVSKDGEVTSSRVIPFSEIAKCMETDLFYAFSHNDTLFLIRKDALPSNSILHPVFSPKIERRMIKKPLEYKIGIALFIATLATIWLALISISLAGNSGYGYSESMWLCFLFLPIPTASIIVGIRYKKKGVKTRKNIIGGVIVAAVLIIYGSFGFLFSDTALDLADVEARTGIDLPEPTDTVNVAYEASVSTSGNSLFYTYYLYFDDADAEAFEAQIAADERWLTKLSTDFEPVIWENADLAFADYFILYDLINQTYNVPPDMDGEYAYIYIIYDADENCAELTEISFSDGKSETADDQ